MFKECRHIMPSGAKCKSPALKDQSFCYYHRRLHSLGPAKGRPKKSLPVPSLEDPRGIQIALTHALGAIGSSPLDNKSAGLYLYGLQIATQLTDRASVPEPRDVVRSLSTDAGSDEILAPESVQCEPGAECDSCPKRDDCVLPARIAYLDARQSSAQALKDLREREQRDIEKGQKSPVAALIDQWTNEIQWEDPSCPEEET